jgi:hypothetical protein
MKLKDTTITTAGVFRCCVQSVAAEIEQDAEIQIGHKSRCVYCHEPFTLTMDPTGKGGIWLPDWKNKTLTTH